MIAIDFFCGAGGSTLGATWAGLEVAAAVNHWLVAAATYALNHTGRVLRQSIQQVSPSDLPRADVLMFSPECTNHSLARGARPRDEISRSTALEVTRFVEWMRPAVFVVENVPEIRKWERFFEWIASLEYLGYRLNHDDGRPGQVLDSANFGVPQSRSRWFLVGRLGERVNIVDPGNEPGTVAECIDWRIPMRPIIRQERPLSPTTLQRINNGQERFGDDPFLLVYYGSGSGVMAVDRPCRTVTTHDRFGLVWRDRIRMLQPAELLRIMGFPDDYRLAGNRGEKVRQLGNAVPPPVMREILKQAV